MTVASIDIGTNTIILLIAEVNLGNCEIKVLNNFHSIPRIGKGLKAGCPMPSENIKRMFDVLSAYSNEIKKYNCEKILVSGTNAFRIASNKDELINEIKNRYGYHLRIITGDEEAELSYLGAVSGRKENNKYLVIDIGGGSTEIIYGTGSNIHFKKSFPVGAVMGSEFFFRSDPPSKTEIQKFISHLKDNFRDLNKSIHEIDTAVAIAGTPTTLACIKHKLKEYDEDIVEGSSLTNEELNLFTQKLSERSYEEIKKEYSSVVEGREDVLLAGTIILYEISQLLLLKEIRVSTKGIRYGVIISWVNSLRQ